MSAANAYAQARGVTMQAPERVGPTAKLQPIDEAEHSRIAANVDAVKQHLPEFWPFIKELHAVGLIDGLRAIQRVEILRKES